MGQARVLVADDNETFVKALKAVLADAPVEILEVALFCLFWLLQTQELWSRYGNAAAVLTA